MLISTYTVQSSPIGPRKLYVTVARDVATGRKGPGKITQSESSFPTTRSFTITVTDRIHVEANTRPFSVQKFGRIDCSMPLS